MIVVVLF